MRDLIRSYYPGRLRARHPALVGMDAETMAQTLDMIRAVEGITAADINPRVGSIVIEWNPEVLSEDDLMGYLSMYEALLGTGEEEGEAAEVAEAPAEEASAACEACTCEPLAESECICRETVKDRVLNGTFLAMADKVLDQGARFIAPDQKNPKRARRVAQNRVMLATFVGSVGALAAGTRVHAYLGWIFAGLLSVHLYQHRRVL